MKKFFQEHGKATIISIVVVVLIAIATVIGLAVKGGTENTVEEMTEIPGGSMAMVTKDGIPYFYSDLRQALEEGDDIKLVADVKLDEPLYITGSKKIDGQGHSIVVDSDSYNRVMSIDENSEDITIELSNITLKQSGKATYSRGISLYGNTGKVDLKMDKVNLESTYYALNVAGKNTGGIYVTASNCEFKGWAAINLWSKVTGEFTNCTLIGLNDKTYNANGWNNFSVLTYDKDGSTSSGGSNLKFNNCTFDAEETTGNTQWFWLARPAGTTTDYESCTFVHNGSVVSTGVNENFALSSTDAYESTIIWNGTTYSILDFDK